MVSLCSEKKRLGFAQKTVSQKIPANWVELAQVDALRISEQMKAAGVEVLLNADETLVKFYPAEDRVVAPKGSQRVGSNIEEDEKAGCTVMVTMEFFTSTLVDPFIVLTAKQDGRLATQWDKYAGPARVVFQKNHWMDTPTAIKYLDWIQTLYPNKKVGLIWDHAGAHICSAVLEHANKLGFVVEFINKGMTSVQQPCDLYANQQIKKIIKDKYHEYRMSLTFEEQTKVKVPRELFVSWVEIALREVNNKQCLTQQVRKTFQKCGLDPYDDEKLEMARWLESLSKETLYNALIQNQHAADLF